MAIAESAALAITVAMTLGSIVTQAKGKGKGKNDNPEVGYRYWGDAMFAVATVPLYTAAVWVNRIYYSGEEYLYHEHNVPGQYGETYHIKDMKQVNAFKTTAFVLANSPQYPIWQDKIYEEKFGKQMNAAVTFAIDQMAEKQVVPQEVKAVEKKADLQHERQYVTHDNGVVMLYGHQIFMGTNTSTIPSFQAIITSIPSSVLFLNPYMRDYNENNGVHLYNQMLVRARLTIDMSWVYSVNPVVIVTDLLLDQHTPDEIDWESCADAASHLITRYPYMWFSTTVSHVKSKDAIQKLLTSAKLRQFRTRRGKIGLFVLGNHVNIGLGCPDIGTIDIKKHVEKFSFTRQTTQNADIVNEMRGEYIAARTKVDIVEVPEGTTDEDRAAMIKADRVYEHHFQEADMHTVNPGNIILTGIRKSQSQDISFLAWPDDAKAYLWDVMSQKDRAFMSGTITGSYWLAQFMVGNNCHIFSAEKDFNGNDLLQFNKVFYITERSFDGYPAETVTLNVEEAFEWYGKFNPCLRRTVEGIAEAEPITYPWDGSPYTDFEGQPALPTEPTVIKPPKDDKPVIQPPKPIVSATAVTPMYVLLGSADAGGVPAMYHVITDSIPSLSSMTTYMASGCGASDFAIEEDPVVDSAGPFPVLATLDEGVAFNAMKPGFVHGAEINATVLCPQTKLHTDEALASLRSMAFNLSGTPQAFFSYEDEVTANYVMFSDATTATRSGDAFCMRAISIESFYSGKDVKVRLRGLYSTDVPAHMTFAKGSIIAILPATNGKTQFGYTPIPVPDFDPMGMHKINVDAFYKTLITVGSETTPWNKGFCAKYNAPHTVHLDSPKPTIYAASSMDNWVPSTRCAFVEDGSSQFSFIISAPDFTSLRENPALGGLEVGGTSALTLYKDLSRIPLLKYGTQSNSGIADIKLKITVKNSEGIALHSENIVSNATMPTFTLNRMGISNLTPGTILKTEFTLYYELTSQVSEETIALKPTTVDGPDIILA